MANIDEIRARLIANAGLRYLPPQHDAHVDSYDRYNTDVQRWRRAMPKNAVIIAESPSFQFAEIGDCVLRRDGYEDSGWSLRIGILDFIVEELGWPTPRISTMEDGHDDFEPMAYTALLDMPPGFDVQLKLRFGGGDQ